MRDIHGANLSEGINGWRISGAACLPDFLVVVKTFFCVLKVPGQIIDLQLS